MNEDAIWKLSWKWATRKFDCNPHGVINGCHGKCCEWSKYWPPRAWSDNKCGYLHEGGCLPIDQRPVGCILSPFQVSKKNVLFINHKVFFKWNPCFPCVNKGPRIIDSLKECYIYLFGEKIYNEMIESVDNENDYSFVAPKWVVDELAKEVLMKKEDKIPLPRNLNNE